jgi:hypothetical protein
MEWPDELVAAHELGHVISAQEGDVPLGDVRIMTSWWSGEVNGGFCELKSFLYPVPGNNPAPGAWDIYRGMLVMTAGGQAAAEHWFQLNDMPVDFTAGSDYTAFRADAAVMPNAPSWDQAMEAARHIILPRWDELLAKIPVLLEKRRMAGNKV